MLHADPASLQQLALQWLRDFALPPPRRIVLALPTSLLHCGLLSQVIEPSHSFESFSHWLHV